MASEKTNKKKLIIVESPTKASTISRFLGKDCSIIASKGHIRTLPKIGLAIDVKHGYTPEYIIDDTKKNVIEQLRSALKNADELILATDEDREGESISWHLLEVLKPEIPYRRMVFHEITKKAILEAFDNGRPLDMNLVHAQEARRVLDRLYGYTISPVLWSKLSNNSLSAGRVQSPGLRLIVDRERLRMNFKTTEYWSVRATFNEGLYADIESWNGKRIAGGRDFDSETGEYKGSDDIKLLSCEDAKTITVLFKDSEFRVTDIKEKNIVQHPAPPFMTSTLQQEGNRKLKMSARDTMRVAQSLYEKGFITYMRTDSLVLSQEGIKGARNAAAQLYGKAFVAESPRKYASKSANAQEAHEAIRPAGETFVLPEESGLTGRELALYTLIFKRTLACQMKDAQKINTTVTITAETDSSGGSEAVFTASGTRIEFPGFIKVYVEGTDTEETAEDTRQGSHETQKETLLPKLEKGMVLDLKALEPLSHTTREPVRFTEAALVKELEKRGIGRPSTYASIIDRILEKNYVVKENGSLVPTFTGFGVMQLMESFREYIEYGFTSEMEKELDEIARGKEGELEYLKNFYEGENGLESQVKKIRETIVPMNVKRISLPQLSEENTITLGKFGPYVQNAEGRYFSVPDTWLPATVTDSMVSKLKESTPENKQNPVVGQTPDGQPIYYCTGRYGDYWQIGDRSKTADVRRFTVPKSLIGKEVPQQRILEYFSLPRTIGTDTDGSPITADIGRYGAYLKCRDDFRSLKNAEDIFTTTESEARKIFSTPKPVSGRSSSGTAGRTYRKNSNSQPDSAYKSGGTVPVRPSSTSAKPNVEIVKDFGQYNGQNLDIRSGRYGFYIKYGLKNVMIDKKYRNDADACREMSLEEAISFVNKSK